MLRLPVAVGPRTFRGRISQVVPGIILGQNTAIVPAISPGTAELQRVLTVGIGLGLDGLCNPLLLAFRRHPLLNPLLQREFLLGTPAGIAHAALVTDGGHGCGIVDARKRVIRKVGAIHSDVWNHGVDTVDGLVVLPQEGAGGGVGLVPEDGTGVLTI